MAFTHAQATTTFVINGISTTISAVLANNPATGDVVIVGFTWFDGAGGAPATLTIADLNNNSYTKTSTSPVSTHALTDGQNYIFFLSSAPANASKTITANYTSPGSAGAAIIHADDFSVSGGTAAIDLTSSGSGTTGGTINTPSVARSGTGALLYFYAGSQNGATSVNAPWTQGAIDADGNPSGYILSASTNTAVNATQSSGTWDAAGISFSFTPTAGSASRIEFPWTGDYSGGVFANNRLAFTAC